MSIKFGPAGLGPVKKAVEKLEEYHKLGFRACEIAFTYGVYIKKEKDAKRIGRVAKRLGIDLSIHSQYWINLNSDDKDKVKKSRERIIECLRVGTFLGAKKVIFHPGYYGKREKEESYENIKNEILELQRIKKERRYTPKLCPETTGKINVFGSIDEIEKLVKDTNCSFCIDFSHILARYKDYRFKEVLKKFLKYNNIHIHFSGIIYGEKGERSHKKTESFEIKKLLLNLPKNKNITLINESPFPVEDSLKSIKLAKNY